MSYFDLALPYSRGADEVPGMFERAEAAEAHGARAVWVSDDWYGLDAFAALGAVGQRCCTPKLGVGLTNPFARHLVQTASAALTVDRMAGGNRVIVAIGRSARYGVEHLGIHFGDGNAALRDSVTILKRLLRGETVTVETEHFQMHDHQLTWPIPDPPIPVYMGAIGPKTLEMAGEIADGVLLSGFNTLPYCRFAMERIRAGAARAGRSPEEVDVVCPQAIFVGDVPDVMYTALSGMVGAMALLPGVAEAIVTGVDVGDEPARWTEEYLS